jgi:signal transduction histidine kinase
LPLFLKNLDDTILHSFTEFVQQSSQKSDTLSSREKRAIKYDLIDELEAIKIENAGEYADWIVDMNMYEESELYLPLLKPTNSKDIFYTAYQLSTIVRSNQTVKIATDRAAKIVFALKNYARQDQTGEKSIVNINDSIEVTLTLYHNQIKHGVDVTRDLGEIPEFMGYPDELVQVWTNIIHNALQAMSNKGRLFIQTSIENDNVLVSIQDNGGGIPKEVQDRIFDAFFTTKPAGEGSGLGLDITRKIIEKHNGKIWFETLEGVGTTFFIQLPLNNNNQH